METIAIFVIVNLAEPDITTGNAFKQLIANISRCSIPGFLSNAHTALDPLELVPPHGEKVQDVRMVQILMKNNRT